MTDIVKIFLVICIIIVLCASVAIGTGAFNVFYKNTIGVATESANRNIYKENKSYVEGMIKDLSSYKNQYELSENDKEKTALKARIINDFANFDINKIENIGLQNFLIEMRGY